MLETEVDEAEAAVLGCVGCGAAILLVFLALIVAASAAGVWWLWQQVL